MAICPHQQSAAACPLCIRDREIKKLTLLLRDVISHFDIRDRLAIATKCEIARVTGFDLETNKFASHVHAEHWSQV